MSQVERGGLMGFDRMVGWDAGDFVSGQDYVQCLDGRGLFCRYMIFAVLCVISDQTMGGLSCSI